MPSLVGSFGDFTASWIGFARHVGVKWLVRLQEINAIKTVIEANKYEIIKYCIGNYWHKSSRALSHVHVAYDLHQFSGVGMLISFTETTCDKTPCSVPYRCQLQWLIRVFRDQSVIMSLL